MELDQYGGYKGIKGTETGFFHTENIDGRNWFITPDGNAFFCVALSHLYSGESDMICNSYYKGDKELWLTDSFKKVKDMGFNCALGSATSPERNLNNFVDMGQAEEVFRKNGFPYTVGLILIKHPWEFIEGETLPDIFGSDYKVFIENMAREICPKYKDDPLVMGYYYGFGAFNDADVWVNHHPSLEPGEAGRVAIVNLLIERYENDAGRFNEVYGTSLEKMEALQNAVVLKYDPAFERRNFPEVKKTLNPRQFEDFEAIMSLMCTTLYKIGHDAIKRLDRNHLILGSFVKEWALSPESCRSIAPYVDMVAPQHINPVISVNELADTAGLPLILSDDYFGFCYPEKCCGHAGVKSDDSRSEIYQANIYRLYKDPQVMGVSYCASMYDLGGKTFEWNKKEGFYDENGQAREPLVSSIRKMNRAVYEHTVNTVSRDEVNALNARVFELWDKHLLTAGEIF